MEKNHLNKKPFSVPRCKKCIPSSLLYIARGAFAGALGCLVWVVLGVLVLFSTIRLFFPPFNDDLGTMPTWRPYSWKKKAGCFCRLPPRLTQIGKEAFLSCIALQEVVIPTELQEIGIRAFCGCEQLRVFTLLDLGENDQHVQAEHDAFLLCDNFEQPLWVELLPTEGPDSDAFDEELYTEFP